MLTPATVGEKEHGFMCKLADLLVPLQIMERHFFKGGNNELWSVTGQPLAHLSLLVATNFSPLDKK